MDDPDEVRTYDKTRFELAKVGDVTVMRCTYEPGFVWSECVGQKLAADGSCQATHTGYVISGRLHVRMDDGTEAEVGPGDAYCIPPGHDGWVVGDETYVSIDVTGADLTQS